MSISISGNATPTQAPVPVQAAPANKPPAATKPRVAAAQDSLKDTVQISAAAQALQEAIENPAQTAKEASQGDPQARRLLAKEQADQVTK
jgi:hypothetical protein